MRTTTLGRDGPEVGVIGLGCMGMTASYDLETPRDDPRSISVIHRALELGMTLIDTADAYGPYTNEELVGEALAGGYRERAVLATKVGLVMGDAPLITGITTASPGAGRNGRPEHVRNSIDGSLRRLDSDHVDLYQLHRVDPEVPLEETWGAMAETVAAGKALAIGLSEVSVGEIQRAQAVHPVASVQSELSLWTRDVLESVLPYCEEHGIAFLPFSRWDAGFSPAVSPRSTTCRRMTFDVICRASSGTRCARTLRSSAPCGTSLIASAPRRRRSRLRGCCPRGNMWFRYRGRRPRNTSKKMQGQPIFS